MVTPLVPVDGGTPDAIPYPGPWRAADHDEPIEDSSAACCGQPVRDHDAHGHCPPPTP